MTLLEISKPHFRIKEIDGSLQISIPSDKPWFRLIISVIWLGVWIYIGFGVFRAAGDPPSVFSLFWLLIWGLSIASIAFDIFWHLGGVETLYINTQTLRIHHAIFGIPIRRKVIELDEIEVMRGEYKRQRRDWYSRRHRRKSPLEGPLTIDVGGKTLHYGNNINEGEAEQIIALIETHMKNG